MAPDQTTRKMIVTFALVVMGLLVVLFTIYKIGDTHQENADTTAEDRDYQLYLKLMKAVDEDKMPDDME